MLWYRIKIESSPALRMVRACRGGRDSTREEDSTREGVESEEDCTRGKEK